MLLRPAFNQLLGRHSARVEVRFDYHRFEAAKYVAWRDLTAKNNAKDDEYLFPMINGKLPLHLHIIHSIKHSIDENGTTVV